MIKVKSVLTSIAVFAIAFTVLAATATPIEAAEQITIVNNQGYVDFRGFYNVVGEVKNVGDTPAKNVYVKVTFMSPEGADEDEGEVHLHTILPGRRAPFSLTAGAQGSTVSSYTIELLDLTMSAEDMPKVLSITSSNTEVVMPQTMNITGTVKNTGTETATYTRVYATFYDGPSGTGNVVAVTGCTAQPYNINAGQTGSFQMAFFITPSKTYTSYVLVAESDQYAADNEYVAATGQTSSASPTGSVSTSPSVTSPSTSSGATASPSGTTGFTGSASPTASSSPTGAETTGFPTTYVVIAVVGIAAAAGAGFWLLKGRQTRLPPPPPPT